MLDIDFTNKTTEYKTLLEGFVRVYPEFESLIKTEEDAEKFYIIFDKIKCIYTRFSDLQKCKELYPFYMLVAHTAVMKGYTKSINILPNTGGIVTNSSVGDVSIGYAPPPYTNEFTYWLGMSPYGKEYLAWLATQSGLTYVNN